MGSLANEALIDIVVTKFRRPPELIQQPLNFSPSNSPKDTKGDLQIYVDSAWMTVKVLEDSCVTTYITERDWSCLFVTSPVPATWHELLINSMERCTNAEMDIAIKQRNFMKERSIYYVN